MHNITVHVEIHFIGIWHLWHLKITDLSLYCFIYLFSQNSMFFLFIHIGLNWPILYQ